MSREREVLLQVWAKSMGEIEGAHLIRFYTLRDGDRDRPSDLVPVTGWLTDPRRTFNAAGFMDSVIGRNFERYWQEILGGTTHAARETILPFGHWTDDMEMVARRFAEAAVPIAWGLQYLFPQDPTSYVSVHLLSPPFGRWQWMYKIAQPYRSDVPFREQVTFEPYEG